MPRSGTYGATAEYRTQLESFSRIRSFGTDPAKGPDYWEVRRKGGLILTYGNTPDAVIKAIVGPLIDANGQLLGFAQQCRSLGCEGM